MEYVCEKKDHFRQRLEFICVNPYCIEKNWLACSHCIV